MAYSTKANMISRIGGKVLDQLVDDTGSDSETEKDARIDDAITDADAMIDSFLGKLYAVPLTSTPTVIIRASVYLALWNLASRRWDVTEAPSTIKTNYDATIAWLTSVAAGAVTLSDPPPLANTDETASTSVTSTSRRLTRDNLEPLV